MLNYLLVLGLIPGTHFQITFYEYLVLIPLAALAAYARHKGVSRADLLHYWQYARIYSTTRPGVQLSLHL